MQTVNLMLYSIQVQKIDHMSSVKLSPATGVYSSLQSTGNVQISDVSDI